MLSEVYPDRVVVNEMKKHITFYLKSKRNAKPTVVAVNVSQSVDEMLSFVESFFAAEPQYRYEKG